MNPSSPFVASTPARMRRGLRAVLSVAVSGMLAVAAATGCAPQARRRALAVVFDGVTDTPRPPTQRVRRDLLREINELKQQLAQAREDALHAKQDAASTASGAAGTPAEVLPIEQARTWEEASKLLPQTEGTPDWAKALRDGIVAPRAGPDPLTPKQAVMSLDVALVPASDATYKVVFPHEAHTSWLSCANCHPGIFQMKQGADPITMDKIMEGQYCGVCHGKVAFTLDACARCHRALSEGKQ